MSSEPSNGRASLTPADWCIEAFQSTHGEPAIELTVRGLAQMRMNPQTALDLAARLAITAAGAARSLFGSTGIGDGDRLLIGEAADMAIDARLRLARAALDDAQKPDSQKDGNPG